MEPPWWSSTLLLLGLSLGHRAVVWLQGSVDGSSQVLGCGALCSAAHGDAGALQRLCCAGADGSELQGQHCHCHCSATAPAPTSGSSQPSTLPAQPPLSSTDQLRLKICSIKSHPSMQLLSHDSRKMSIYLITNTESSESRGTGKSERNFNQLQPGASSNSSHHHITKRK